MTVNHVTDLLSQYQQHVHRRFKLLRAQPETRDNVITALITSLADKVARVGGCLASSLKGDILVVCKGMEARHEVSQFHGIPE